MTYTKQTWVDGADGGTPLSADRLSHMEDGIADGAKPTRTGQAGKALVTDGTNDFWGYPASIAPIAGSNPLTGKFLVLGYGAKADARTYDKGTITGGFLNILADTTNAPFTAADVGKVVVICNAKGAGVHLYTTINGFTDASHVTLANAATTAITNQPYSYGTDDTAHIQAAITDAQAVGGTVVLAPSASMITATLTWSDALSIEGAGAKVISGSNKLSGTDKLAASNYPTRAPYLTGSTIVVGAPNIDAMHFTVAGRSCDLTGFGILFAGLWKNTGHGIIADAPALGTGKDIGMMEGHWENIYVMGVDDTHYAWYLYNHLCCTFIHLQGWGGGGVAFDVSQDPAVGDTFGNSAWINFWYARMTGNTVYGIDYKQFHNLDAWIRPQVLAAASEWPGAFINAFNLVGTGRSGIRLNCANCDFINLNTEGMDLSGSLLGNFISPGSALTIANMPDTLPFMYQDGSGNRRINKDGSVALDIGEGANSFLALLKDRVSNASWGITTDGTVQMLRPGTVRHTGSTPPTAAVGAALGTSPPPIVPAGADSAGRCIFGSGTSPAAGAIGTFTFSRAMQVGAVVNLTPLNAATQALGLYVSGLTTTGFTVSCANAPSASQAVSTYAFSWTAEDVTAAPVAPVIFATFNGTDSASSVGSPEIGPNPTVVSGTWGRQSNRLYSSAGAGDILWDAGKADATWQITFGVIGGAPAQDGFTYRAVDGTNFWIVCADGSVYKQVTGTYTLKASLGALSAGDVIKVVTSGSTHTFFKNGVQVGSPVTDAALNTATKCGGHTGSTAGVRLDNLQVI